MDIRLFRCVVLFLVFGGNETLGSSNGRHNHHGFRYNPACPRGQCSGRRSNTSMISLSLVQQMANVVDFEDLANRFIINKKQFLDQLDIAMNDSGFENRFGDGKKAIRALPPTCTPQPSLVSLEPMVDDLQASDIIMPPCIRVNRCSGCCHDVRFLCEPTTSEHSQYLVSVLELNNYNENYRFKRWLKINVDTHLSCKCSCRTKEKDCNERQFYLPKQCLCICLDAERRSSCETANRLWDEETCSCRCPNETDCSMGAFYDQNSCQCKRALSLT